MTRRLQPAPDAIYTCDKLKTSIYREVRLYDNRLEVDRLTAWLHRFKRVETYYLPDLIGVDIKRKDVTLHRSAVRSVIIEFKRKEDAQAFVNAFNSIK
nr:MAG TPA: hypothetical protein [Caudoviricetes sp.]